MRPTRGCVTIVLALLVAACASPSSTPGPSAQTAPPSVQTAPPSTQSAASTDTGVGSPSADCGPPNVTLRHQAPEVEALLPASVQGRALARWSVRGRCWADMVINRSPSEIDAFLAQFETPDDPRRIDMTHLTYGVAGRSDTTTDPPFTA